MQDRFRNLESVSVSDGARGKEYDSKGINDIYTALRNLFVEVHGEGSLTVEAIRSLRESAVEEFRKTPKPTNDKPKD